MIIAAIALATQIDRIANDAMSKSARAGMSIAVTRRGQTILAKGYGLANVELGVPATADTVYHIDSISKHLTAGAILRLVEERKLSLDDPLTKYVQGLPAAWAGVKIRHLLNHTSGSASYTALPSWGPQERLDVSHEDILSLVRDVPFHFQPGAGWSYNNTGFYLLGMVIENVTGQSYAEAMRALVFAPLGMSSTRYCGFRDVIKNRAAGYDVRQGKLTNAEPMSWAAPFAGGGLCSTVGDLVRYESALEEHRLFGATLLDEMRAPTALPDGTIDYGFGTRAGRLGTHGMVGHTGNGGGFRNILERFPNDDLTIVVLSNTDSGSVSILAARIASVILGIAEKPPQDLPIPSAEIGSYVGRFSSDEGTVENVAVGERIGFRFAPDAPVQPLRYQGEGTFIVAPDIAVTFFILNGRATWAQSYVGGMFDGAHRRIP